MSDTALPLDPILVPDSPEKATSKRKRRSKPKPAVVPLAEKVPNPPPDKQKPEPPRFTIEDAFDYLSTPACNESELQNERCVRAVAFLLHYCSEVGNEEVQGFAAHGLAHILEKCASNMARAHGFQKLQRERGGES